MSPAKHSYVSVTDGRTMDKVIPMCRYASQATQKLHADTFSIPDNKARIFPPIMNITSG